VQKKRGYTNAKSIAKKRKLLLLWIGIACRSEVHKSKCNL
jgi:hypothetical protein